MCRIRINPKHKDNNGLLLHEIEHVRQWYICTAIGLAISSVMLFVIGPTAFIIGLMFSTLIHSTLYTYSRYCRLKFEVAAFKIQIANTQGNTKQGFINVLATDYDLNITKAEAEKLLYNTGINTMAYSKPAPKPNPKSKPPKPSKKPVKKPK